MVIRREIPVDFFIADPVIADGDRVLRDKNKIDDRVCRAETCEGCSLQSLFGNVHRVGHAACEDGFICFCGGCGVEVSREDDRSTSGNIFKL